MTETFLTLVATWGVYAISLSAFLSCLLVPVPTALVMLAGGAFAAAGDLSVQNVLFGAWLAAVLGDQTGFHVGRRMGPLIERYAYRRRKTREAHDKARNWVAAKGEYAVFLSTWALAPMGPYVNFAAGAGGLGLLRFTVWDALGEAIWVGVYVMAGFFFASEIAALAEILEKASGFLVCLAGAGLIGWIAWNRMKTGREE